MCSGDGVMKKIILHVGQYKTGSTSVQKLLWGARKELKEYGILYPDSFGRDGAHFQITDLLRKEFRGQSERVDLEPLREEVMGSPAHTAVISCEPLSGATVRRFAPEMMQYMWERLAHLFHDCEVRVLVYMRRQDDSIDSRIIQEIKGQSRKSGLDYAPFLYAKSSLNYHYFTRLLEETFGTGRVDCRLYDRRFLCNGDVRYDILAYLGIAEDAIVMPDSEDNVSPSAKLVAFYRFVNALNLGDEDYERITSGIWQGFCGADESKAVVLDSEARKEVMRFFQPCNEAFIAECVAEEYREMFAAALLGAVREVESNVFMDCVDAVRLLADKGYAVSWKDGDAPLALKVMA
jgi:hypothetical protein